MSSVSNGSVTSKSSAKLKFSAQIKDLLGAAKRVLASEKDVENLDQILDEKKRLEGELKLRDTKIQEKEKKIAELWSIKNKEIAQLQSAKNTLFEEFQTRFRTWDSDNTKQKELEGEVKGLEWKLSQADERARSSKNDLAALQNELNKSQDAQEETVQKLRSVTKQLDSKKNELEGAQKELECFRQVERE